MNILLIGSGGREHALAWKMSFSPLLSTLFIAPGNPGTASLGVNVPLDVSNHDAVIQFCRTENIELVVVGPEQPLVDGLVDALEKAGVPAFGPKKQAALLEGSKSYAKSIMQQYGIPTAGYRVFSSHELDAAIAFCRTEATLPIVLKLDGLAGGKGVYICDDREEAAAQLLAVKEDVSLASASASLVIEEFMHGEEVSVFALCDGKDFVFLSSAQDHKRIGDNDTGPNTGGMGAYAPAPLLSKNDEIRIAETVVKPMLKAMQDLGCPYVGILYCGMMMTGEGPKVVEFNCRFGDPECEVLMPLLKSDLIELMLAACNGVLSTVKVELSSGFACTVVAAAQGYPASPKKGDKINLPEKLNKDTILFHSGTVLKNGDLVSSGGRVLNCVGTGETLPIAISNAYDVVHSVSFEGKYFRTDIGLKGLARLKN